MPEILVRQAAAADAARVSALYDQAYKPPDGGRAGEHYPFPQILEPQWVAQAISDGWIYWVVAEREGQIIGSAAAVRNIGSAEDRVAEVFGIVVRQDTRGTGCARRLLATLYEGLGDGPQFVLCESRTALAAGWKVARRGGFYPLGFEPFAHRTPAGSEAMLLTGRIQPLALAARASDAVYAAVQPLAGVVLGEQASAMTPVSSASQKYPLHGQTWSELSPACRRLSTALPQSGFEPLSLVTVSRDDAQGKRFIQASSDKYRHRSGVIAFQRFEGDAPERYDRQYHVVRVGQQALAAALVVLDRIDQRARILDLRTCYEGSQGILLSAVVAALTEQASDKRMVMVIDVRADAFPLQDLLSTLGFHPTIYYPSFIARGSDRIDGVQYTRLLNCDFKDTLACLETLDWSAAVDVVRAVHSGFLAESEAINVG